MMKARKEQIEAIKQNGDLARVIGKLSAAYFLVNVASALYMDCDDILKSYGLRIGEVKKKSNGLQRAFDVYIGEFGKMVVSAGQNMKFAEDYDELAPKILSILGLKE